MVSPQLNKQPKDLNSRVTALERELFRLKQLLNISGVQDSSYSESKMLELPAPQLPENDKTVISEGVLSHGSPPANNHWWRDVAGSFEDDPHFEEATQFGREWRQSAD